MEKVVEYKTPRAEVRGVFLCDEVADTIFSPVRRADVEAWIEEEVTDGGDVFLTL